MSCTGRMLSEHGDGTRRDWCGSSPQGYLPWKWWNDQGPARGLIHVELYHIAHDHQYGCVACPTSRLACSAAGLACSAAGFNTDFIHSAPAASNTLADSRKI